MRVTILDSNQETLDLASKSLQGDVECIKADVSSRSDWQNIRRQVGDVDFLMLNAGVTGRGTWGDDEYFDKILDTNLGGVINGLNAYVPSFKAKEGKEKRAIVITGSKQGITNPPGNAAYNASKAAVKALTEHLSYDLRDTDVGVHLLVPGWTFTGLVRPLLPPPPFPLPNYYTNNLTHSPAMYQAQKRPNQTAHGHPSKSQTICTKRCRTESSTSSALTMM
jgi:NAD(P)-dependent dehydrogenase (short-subunit alcohol dehydrogenase family)